MSGLFFWEEGKGSKEAVVESIRLLSERPSRLSSAAARRSLTARLPNVSSLSASIVLATLRNLTKTKERKREKHSFFLFAAAFPLQKGRSEEE